MKDPIAFRLEQDPVAGFYRVSPTPAIETLQQLYSHEYYVTDKPAYLEKTASEVSYWHSIWDLRLGAMALASGRPGRLLDVGASGGFFLDHARSCGWDIAGVEPSIQSAAYARKHFQIDLFNGYLEDYPGDGEPFQAVHLSLVLEHVRDPKLFLEKALSLLCPGGLIWVETPNDFNALQEVITSQLEKPQWWVVPEHHLNYFDYTSLSKLLKSLGAKELDRMGSFPMELFPLMGLDYIGNDTVGAQAHGYRMNFEKRVLARDPHILAELYRALARAGMGRTCNILAQTSVD